MKLLRTRALWVVVSILALVLVACNVTSLTGPQNVLIGQSATYDVTVTSFASGGNASVYVFMDVPLSWTVTAATYDATINGTPTSGTATVSNVDFGPCVAEPPPAAGYQRISFSATFPTVTDTDTGTLHVTFQVGGPVGDYVLSAFGGGTFAAPTASLNAPVKGNPKTDGVSGPCQGVANAETLAVTVGAGSGGNIPTLSMTMLMVMAGALGVVALLVLPRS